jgi:hypothetical protein
VCVAGFGLADGKVCVPGHGVLVCPVLLEGAESALVGAGRETAYPTCRVPAHCNLPVNSFSRARIDASVAELVAERDAVQSLNLI